MTKAADHLYSYRYPHPAVTTDVVVFAIFEEMLHLLLVKRGQEPFKGSWAIPGGFLEIDEDLDDCARRELKEETGVEGIYLEQLHTFGEPRRDPRERVVSVAYFAIAQAASRAPEGSSDASDARWFQVDQLPQLAFDHRSIISLAHRRLIAELDCSTIACRFLPERFTLTELQKVYEIIRDNRMDKRNFRKNITGSGLIEETGEQRRDGNHRPAHLYRIKDQKGYNPSYSSK